MKLPDIVLSYTLPPDFYAEIIEALRECELRFRLNNELEEAKTLQSLLKRLGETTK